MRFGNHARRQILGGVDKRTRYILGYTAFGKSVFRKFFFDVLNFGAGFRIFVNIYMKIIFVFPNRRFVIAKQFYRVGRCVSGSPCKTLSNCNTAFSM